MRDQLENFVNDHREEFDSQVPPPNMLERIQAQMEATKETQGSSSTVYRLPSTVYRWAAAAVVILLVGVGVWMSQSSIVNRQESGVRSQESVVSKKGYRLRDTGYGLRVKEQPLLAQVNNQSETRISNHETQNSKLIAMRLSNMESASARYAAVSEIMEMKKIDRDIIEVLVKTMNNDPNSNVRLAALESLGKYYREPYVKKQLVSAMSKQKDPVVQIALIEMLTKFRNTSIANELKKLAEDGNTTKPVKDQAYSSLLKYSL